MRPNGKEKRRFRRVDVPYTITIHTLKGRAISTYVGNFSGGGVKVSLKEKLEVHSIVELELYFEQQPIVCKGRVVWVKEGEGLSPDSPPLFYAGIKFFDINPEDRIKIKKRAKEMSKAKRELPLPFFMFQVKLVIFVSLLLMPVFLFLSANRATYSFLSKIPRFCKPPFEIISIQSYPYNKEKSLGVIDALKKEAVYGVITDEGILYAKTNRQAFSLSETEQLKKSIKEILDNKDVKKLRVKGDSQRYKLVNIPGYKKRVISARLTSIGYLIDKILMAIVGVLCIWLYFLLIRAIINLLRKIR